MNVLDDITEKENALLKYKERFQNILANTGDWIWEIDKKGRYTYSSPTSQQVLGYRYKEIIGKHFFDFFHPDECEKLKNLTFNTFRKKRKFKGFINKRVHKDGHIVILETSGVPILDDNGDLLGFSGIDRDITKRNYVEQLQNVIYKISSKVNSVENIDEFFQDIHKHLNTVIDTTNFYIALYDQDKDLLSFPYFADEKDSQPAPKKFGRGLTEYVIRTGEPHYLTGESIYKLAEKGEIELFGTPSKVWLGAPLRKDSKIIGLVAVQSYTDSSVYTEKDLEILQYVSDRIAVAINHKQYEQNLRDSEERFRFIAENTGDILYRLRYETMTFEYLNPAVVLLTGYTAKEINETGFSSIIKQMLIPGFPYVSREELMQKRKERTTEEWKSEYEILTKNGKIKWLLDHSFPWKDESGKIIGAIGVLQDITERKLAEEEKLAFEAQLRQNQKLESIGTLASGVAHEINNPLMGIINYAQLIKDRISDDSLKEFSEGIIEEGDRIAKIVSNLLSFARQDKESHSPSHIKDIIDASLSLIGAVLRKDQITLIYDIPEELPNVRCRSQQIEQVIINILTNARDALNERYPGYDDDKIVKISVKYFKKDEEKYIRTTIEDHGIGMRQDVIDYIFDPFFTTKPMEKGTGLGLSVSYGIIKEHNGKFSVESKLGKYTRFQVDLPINN